MTKRVDVVNLSNWEGEDFRIQVGDQEVILKPGENCTVAFGGEINVTIEDVKMESKARPFMIGAENFPERTVQTWPELRVDWKSDRGIKQMNRKIEEPS